MKLSFRGLALSSLIFCSLPYSAKVPCSSRGWGRRSGKTTALYEEDDDVHDDLYGIHVL